MKRLALAALLAIGTSSALAQYQGPAVEACRAFAKKEVARDNAQARDVVFERDAQLALERYARKLGTQQISSILTGNGAVVFDGTPSAELSFICLLADEKRPVFFNWMPRQDTSALSQCSRSDELRGKRRACLQFLLQVAETDLTQAYAQRFQEARERDVAATNENATSAYRKANEEWRQYRDAECDRRREQPPSGVSPEDVQLACTVDITRRRALDMR
jgi:uncharacterized protein YecT (DUF1311 family)